MPRTTLFEYRAWPEEGMPHLEAVHHLFGLGVAEMRTDTYLFSPNRPQWMIVLRGGTNLEILEKTGEDAPLSVWKSVAESPFPLRRSIVRALQEAFPDVDLSHKILVPGDIISWLDLGTTMFTVSNRTVHFQQEGCVAEIAQIEAHGRRAQTFSLMSKRPEIVMDALGMLPAPRLPNMDYGSWLQRRPWNAQVLEVARSVTSPMPVMGAAQVA